MHSSTIFTVAIAAFGFFGEASAYCNWNKKTIENCCYRDNDARVRQGGYINFPQGTICPESHSNTCGADCCTFDTGLGIGCPK
ncbi:hypothetical protein CPAR01_09184 [Colletotrichum paranaense]|uniref:Uncharacterized protein n=1 Tax=Colletotrichum paranaense TaxID=1914294 RepID=A0ABQ9SG04_9PEZI|nr:uncharacterized protein CPAR01_09184 [Colletotrichum paranaense]KAK1535642.1 hypothetical protein CPAR01_09184 [Colletotrichum paranaense]